MDSCAIDTFSRRGLRDRIAKRVIDFCGAAFLIVLTTPLLLLIAALVRLLEGAPVIYRRRVVGVDGEFDAFKFRTMRKDADRMLQTNPELEQAFRKNFKLKADPRVTAFGSFLRTYSLDELPQLFNVFLGEMSLVGPRMITRPELQKYGPHQDLLRTVKPGLTGYWQVHGRQKVSYDERVRMDVEYIRRRTLGMDFRILIMTPLRVIRGEGAY
jgi:lipopolysaccharide/colanic/teichoic acid biosynthesis glycosyltransferase